MEPIQKINKVEVRNLQMDDYAQLAQSFTRVYADKDVFWTREQIKTLITIFPEGQIVTVVDDKIVGCALSIIVDYDMVKGDHTYAKVTGNETFNTHNPKGNILYGIEDYPSRTGGIHHSDIDSPRDRHSCQDFPRKMGEESGRRS